MGHGEWEQSLHQMVLRELGICMQKNKVGPLPHTIYKNFNSKRIKNLKVRAKTIKLLEENINLWQWFLRYDTKSTATKEKRETALYQNLKCFVHSKKVSVKIKNTI